MVVDTGRLDGIKLDASRRHVRIGAGATLGRIHEVLDDQDLTVPTGTCPTVGVAGLTLGGGIGAESRLYGLTLDAVTAIRVVTGDGRVRTASDNENPALFWAMRGGGGGNCGVATEFVMRTSPALPAEFFFLRWGSSHAVDVVRGWQERLLEMPRTGWANVHLEAVSGTVVPRIVGVSWGGSGRAQARALINAVGAPPVAESYAFRSHRGAMSMLAGSGAAVRRSWVAGSDVVEAPLSAARAKAIVAVVRRRGAVGSAGALILDPLDGAVHEGSTRTSSFPWRRAAASLQWYVGLASHTSAAAVESGRRFIARGHAAVGSASSGGYVNYLEPGRPVRAYYGDSWPDLLNANKVYDPAGLFSSRYSLPN